MNTARPRFPLRFATAPALCAAFFLLLSRAIAPAATVIWDAGSGDWEDPANWDGGLPGPDDHAQLLNVSSGTRTVTVGEGFPQEINQFTMTQTTVGAVNRLLLNDDLTISTGNAAPLAVTPTAGVGSIVIDIAAGSSFLATRTGNANYTYGATLNLLGADSTFELASSTHANTTNYSGTINAAAGSEFRITGTSLTVDHSGVSSFDTGSTFVLDYTNSGGSAVFTNSGTLTQDGAKLSFEWNASGNQTNARNYHNTGTWTLQNNASLLPESTTGRPTDGGFLVLVDNTNAGTLNVESGSTLTSRSITNTGTINLGSSTAGVSDATSTLGGLINQNIILDNGTASTSGEINVLGDAVFGRTTSAATSNTAILNIGGTDATGSSLNIGDGTTPVLFTIGHDNATLNNFSGNTVLVRENATLRLASVRSNTTTGGTTLTNAGSLTQQGTIQFRSNASGSTRDFTTSGTHIVSGTDAVIESLTNSFSGTAPAIAYSNTGVLSGATASDRLIYVNSSGNAAHNVLTLNLTDAQFAPGDGSNGSGVSSIGSLAFENIKLNFAGDAVLTFDIGGTSASGLFDTVSLLGDGAVFTLGGNSTLDIRLVNGFAPTTEHTYTLVSADSINGTFTNLLFNGGAVTDQYTIDYNADSITVSIIPEPSSPLLILLAGALLLAARRKRIA